MNLKITVSLNGVVLRRIKLSHILDNTVTDRGYASAYAEDHQIYNIYIISGEKIDNVVSSFEEDAGNTTGCWYKSNYLYLLLG